MTGVTGRPVAARACPLPRWRCGNGSTCRPRRRWECPMLPPCWIDTASCSRCVPSRRPAPRGSRPESCAESSISPTARRPSRQEWSGALRADDWMVSTHRSHQHAIAKGVPPGPMMAEVYERAHRPQPGQGRACPPVRHEAQVLGHRHRRLLAAGRPRTRLRVPPG